MSSPLTVAAWLLCGWIAGGTGLALGAAPAAAPRVSSPVHIVLKTDAREWVATLDDNAAARAFVGLLPLELTLTDYNATEKISDLPEKLRTDGTPPGYTPEAGDIAYYAPWGNLALFYRGFGYSSGLVRLGRLRDGVDDLRRKGPLRVRIELRRES